MSKTGLADSLFSRTKNLILKELTLAGDNPVHLRELARRTGLDPSGIQRELKKLSTVEMVLVQRMGNQTVYRLNPECPIYPELRAIILKTSGLADELKTALEPLSGKILKAYIYGSAATGAGSSNTDVDLIVVGAVSMREIVGVTSKIGAELGRVINATVMRPEEYAEQMQKKGSVLRQGKAGTIIELMGKEDEG